MKKLVGITLVIIMFCCFASLAAVEDKQKCDSDLRYLSRLEGKLGALINESLAGSKPAPQCAFKPVDKDTLMPRLRSCKEKDIKE